MDNRAVLLSGERKSPEKSKMWRKIVKILSYTKGFIYFTVCEKEEKKTAPDQCNPALLLIWRGNGKKGSSRMWAIKPLTWLPA